VSRILVVDDDRALADVVVGYLVRAGHQATTVQDGRQALEQVAAELPDLILLDLMLPEIDGLQVCRRVRAEHPDLPIVMLTALGEAEDRIAGLELGADDYVTKPFSPRELVLRIDSVLRRAGRNSNDQGTVLVAGSVTVDTAARQASRDGQKLALTVRELDLLSFLLAHPGRAFTRAELMQQVWGWTYGDQSTVTVHVRRLREKVEDDPTNPLLIRTVWGIGYRLELP
jgi:DNA-binding response OmpR family regulator